MAPSPEARKVSEARRQGQAFFAQSGKFFLSPCWLDSTHGPHEAYCGGWDKERYMHDIGFVGDLAIVMLVAGLTTLVFHKLRQPVLLGYILAGILIGPHTPGVLVEDPRTI